MADFDIQKCYEILELEPGATAEDAKRAHRDLVSIWHPDRISVNNPRLKKKADEKLKEINAAYRNLLMYLNANDEIALRTDLRKNSQPQPDPGSGIYTEPRASEPSAATPKASLKKSIPILSLIGMLIAGLIYSYWQYYIKIEYNQKAARQRLQLSEDHKRDLLEKLVKQTQPPDQVPYRQDSVEKGTQKSLVANPPMPQKKESEDRPRRLHSAQPLDKKPLKQEEIEKIDAIIFEAENYLYSKEYLASKNAYESALKMIQGSQFKTARLFLARKREIERALLSRNIVYGSKGYVQYGDQWIAPDEYRKHSVKYKGRDTYYKELKNIIAQITDLHIRKYLTSKYKDQLIHKKKIECYKVVLLKQSPLASHFQVFYRWEVWTFKIIDEGDLYLNIAYQPESDKWQIGKIYDG